MTIYMDARTESYDFEKGVWELEEAIEHLRDYVRATENDREVIDNSIHKMSDALKELKELKQS